MALNFSKIWRLFKASISFCFIFPHLLILFLLFLQITSCNPNNNEGKENNKVCFHYNDQQHIIVKAFIDTLNMDFLFDTGGNGILLIDTSIYNKYFQNIQHKKEAVSTFSPLEISDNKIQSEFKVCDTMVVKLAGEELIFSEFRVCDTKAKYGTDGLLSIPKCNKKVWELNFEECYISISDSCNVRNMDNPFVYGMSFDGNYYYIKDMPLLLTSKCDTFRLVSDYIVDTGSYREILSIGGKNKYDNNNLYRFLNENSIVHFDTKNEVGLFNNYYINESYFVGDTITLEINKTATMFMEILGIRFLSRYNVTMDLNNLLIYMEPIVHNPPQISIFRRKQLEGFAIVRTTKGHCIVNYVDKGSYIYRGGLRIGDEIISINGIPFQMMDRSELLKKNQRYTVLRNDKIIELVIAKEIL